MLRMMKATDELDTENLHVWIVLTTTLGTFVHRLT